MIQNLCNEKYEVIYYYVLFSICMEVHINPGFNYLPIYVMYMCCQPRANSHTSSSKILLSSNRYGNQCNTCHLFLKKQMNIISLFEQRLDYNTQGVITLCINFKVNNKQIYILFTIIPSECYTDSIYIYIYIVNVDQKCDSFIFIHLMHFFLSYSEKYHEV